MPPEPKASRDDLHDVIQNKCIENASQSRILVTVGSIQSDLIIEKEIDVTRKTIREKGVCPQGYFQKKYPNAVRYKTDGSPESRGMVIEPKQYLLDSGEFESKEELIEELDLNMRVCDECEQFCEEWESDENILVCLECLEEIEENSPKNLTDLIIGVEQ